MSRNNNSPVYLDTGFKLVPAQDVEALVFDSSAGNLDVYTGDAVKTTLGSQTAANVDSVVDKLWKQSQSVNDEPVIEV